MLRRLITAGLICLALWSSAAPSAVADVADDATIGRFFGIRPKLAGTTTLESGHFAYDVGRDAVVHDATVIVNYRDQPLTVSTYVVDMVIGKEGAMAPGQPSDKPKHVGAWTRLDDASHRSVVVPPKGQLEVPFTLQVPKNASPGDYAGAFVAAVATGRTQNGLAVETRAALTMKVRVLGKIKPALAVGQPSVHRSGGAYEMGVLVKNTGNALATLTGRIDLGDHGSVNLGGSSVYVIPGGETTLTARWDKAPLFGEVTSRPSVTANVRGVPSRTFSGPAKSFRVVAWAKFGAGAGALAAVASSLLGLQWSRRRARVRRTEREIVRRYYEAQRSPAGAS